MPVSPPLARPPLVLVANDQEWSARSLESILGPNGYAVLRAYTGRQALQVARDSQPDAVILDQRMPDLSGVELCRQLRADPSFGEHTPILVTTSGAADRAQCLDALAAGAWDFLAQPIDGEVLLVKLMNFVRAKREIDVFRDESLLDRITGLYNMRGLARRAREMGADAVRQNHSLACVAVAAEAVKADGRAPADEVAAKITQNLSTALKRIGRGSDVVGRLGQSEFAVVAPSTEARGAVRMVERLQTALDDDPMLVDGVPYVLKVRAGYCAVADFSDSSIDAVEMLVRASTALRQGRDDGDARPITAFDEAPLRLVP